MASWNFIDATLLTRDELMRRHDPQLVQTRDGGQHWEKVADRSLDWIQFFGDRLGYGMTQSRFLKTDDGGRTWTDVDFPRLGYVYRRFFISSMFGWVAGAADGSSVVYRTIDGGKTWRQSRGAIPSGHIWDLWFYDSQRGWMIIRPVSGKDSYLFSTVDGGETWSAEPDKAFRGIHKLATAVRFVSKEIGFVFEDEITYTRSEAPTFIECAQIYCGWRRSLERAADVLRRSRLPGIRRRYSV